MEKILEIGISDIIGRENYATSFGNEIIVIELKGNGDKKTNMKQETKMRFDAFSIVIMLNGEINININGEDYHFLTPVILDIMDLHVFKNMKISSDFEGYHLIVSKSFIKESMQGMKHLPLSNYLSRYNYPAEHITTEEGSLIQGIILRLIHDISRHNHCYHNELIRNELRCLLMEISDIVIHKSDISSKKVLRNKNEIIMRFVKLMNTNCKEQHSVEFYANELCIDPKYLSRILKSLNGKTASQWIDEAIISEAQLHLRNNDLTIQQIADILNFSDQSSFGKFFKKHCGLSPSNFRIKRNV